MSKILIMILPLIVLQLGLLVYALIRFSKDGVKNLTPIAWLLIIIFINTIGPILYLTMGRDKDDPYNEFD